MRPSLAIGRFTPLFLFVLSQADDEGMADLCNEAIRFLGGRRKTWTKRDWTFISAMEWLAIA